jgi:hypothetical protein
MRFGWANESNPRLQRTAAILLALCVAVGVVLNFWLLLTQPDPYAQLAALNPLARRPTTLPFGSVPGPAATATWVSAHATSASVNSTAVALREPTASPTTRPSPTVATPSPTPAPVTCTSLCVNDGFGRSSADGWGTAEGGGRYALQGPAGDFTVDGSAGKVRVSAPGVGRGAYQTTVAVADLRAVVRVSTDKIATGSGQYAYIAARSGEARSAYYVGVRLSPERSVYLRSVRLADGTEVVLGKEVRVPELAVAPGTWLRLRVEVTGAAPTMIRASVWEDGVTEANDWQFEVSDSDPRLQHAGGAGLFAYLPGSSTNSPVTFSFDDLRVDHVRLP